jgi:hypothetical protein
MANVDRISSPFHYDHLEQCLFRPHPSLRLAVMGCTRDRNVDRGTKGFRVRKTGLSSTLVKLRYNQ